MLTLSLLLILALVATSVALAYLLGFRLGREHSADVLLRVREEGLLAEQSALRLCRDALQQLVDRARGRSEA